MNTVKNGQFALNVNRFSPQVGTGNTHSCRENPCNPCLIYSRYRYMRLPCQRGRSASKTVYNTLLFLEKWYEHLKYN